MQDNDLSLLAKESLETITEIASTAAEKLQQPFDHSNSLALSNSFTNTEAINNLDNIHKKTQEDLEWLQKEPAIMRVVYEDENEEISTVYISRRSNLVLPSNTKFASYRSPLGRIAELAPGDEEKVSVQGQPRLFSVIDKTYFTPKQSEEGWDSTPSQYRHYDKGSWSISSLRELLEETASDNSDELEALLAKSDTAGLKEGISHQVRTAMSLRDQPILDKFQGEIFRLALDSQLIILGPPGTGKTTTLIKRLGQKLDAEALTSDEKQLVTKSNSNMAFNQNWLMFTPSELLKHYLKEAFNREQVPADDGHLRTWQRHRDAIARNSLSLLRNSNNNSGFTLKKDGRFVGQSTLAQAGDWYKAFAQFHESRLRKQLSDGLELVEKAATDEEQVTVVTKLREAIASVESGSLVSIYRRLNDLDGELREALDSLKQQTDKQLNGERNRLYNQNKEIYIQLAEHVLALKQNDDQDDEEEALFDDETESEATLEQRPSVQLGVKYYISAMRSYSRLRFLKRSPSKNSRTAAVVEFLSELLPSQEILTDIGRSISLQSGLRRFVNSQKHYVQQISTAYRQFRKAKEHEKFYESLPENNQQITSDELDLILLLTLKNARELLGQNYIKRQIGNSSLDYLEQIQGLFRAQIMVDEATDFSMLALACMANLTDMQTRSFFACGDFNQRITQEGVRSREQLEWAIPDIDIKSIQTVYRQSQKLNGFAADLLKVFGGDTQALGKLPDENTHEGVAPALVENADRDSAIEWIADRIKEVERMVRTLPTIAVLVCSGEDVKPVAEALSSHLEDISLQAVACEEGKSLGDGTDVRVFDIQHIKGLEFEAVFFVGLDLLEADLPELFERYLYVGATRAATYLGLICRQQLPDALKPLQAQFVDNWN